MGLDAGQLDDLVNGSLQAFGVLATGSSEVGLTTATSLYQLGSLLHQSTGLQPGSHQVVAQHDGEHRLTLELGAGHEKEAFGHFATQLEGDVLHRVGR